MKTLTRAQALAALALLPAACSSGVDVTVGSKNFSEDVTVAEIYAAALERAGLRVARSMNLGSTQIATAALERGDIDLYPEYTGTGLIDVLHEPPLHGRGDVFAIVKRRYAREFGLTWLQPAPANDSQGLVTTRAIARRYAMTTLSACARLAPHFALAAIPEFVVRPDALPGLQRWYGGFHFASARTYTIGLQYEALARGDAQVAAAFTTDAQIAEYGLVVLTDDRHFWPPYNIAPVARTAILRKEPRIAAVLNGIAPRLTNAAVQQMNVAVNIQMQDPAAVARAFLR